MPAPRIPAGSARPSDAADHSNVLVFPPVIPVTGFLVGVLIQALRPLALPGSAPARRAVGAAILAVGAAGFAWMVATMKKEHTPIHNAATPTTLVTSGPFRFTRNPMYLFGAIAYAGLALVLAQTWSLILLPLVLGLTHYGVVLREEAYLEQKFGHAYTDYRHRVRRWL